MNQGMRPTLRDLPVPAKLVLTVFLMMIGLGYISAMMQLHFNSGQRDGNVLPTPGDVVKRYSGQDWPLNGKPSEKAAPADDKKEENNKHPDNIIQDPAPKDGVVAAIKIKTLLTVRCVECHQPGGEAVNPDDDKEIPFDTFEKLSEYLKPSPAKSKIHTVLTGPVDSWGKKSMVQAFTLKTEVDSIKWSKVLESLKDEPAKQQELIKQRDTERKAMIAWVLAGAKKAQYDADNFPLPDALKKEPLTEQFAIRLDAKGKAVEPPKDKEVAKDPPKLEPQQPVVVEGNQIAIDQPVKVKIQSLISLRCNSCHREQKKDVPLNNFSEINRLLVPEPMKGKMYHVIKGPPTPRFSKDNMSQAFTVKSENWIKILKMRIRDELFIERENERLALIAWLEAGATKQSYDNNEFDVPAGKLKGYFTKELLVGNPDPVRAIVTLKQIDFDSLVQSTHAHLLTFALLWSFTGLIFAFTSYKLWIRVLIAPSVLAAQFADVLCWWLARLPDVGPYFALGIMGTGAIVGMGLTLQILLSMFNMYGGKGKLLLALICLFGIGGLGTVYIKYIAPELEIERKETAAMKGS